MILGATRTCAPRTDRQHRGERRSPGRPVDVLALFQLSTSRDEVLEVLARAEADSGRVPRARAG